MLDRLLARLTTEHPDLPRSFAFAPDTDALVTALNQRLMARDANWDSRRGTSRHGAPGDALKVELAAVLSASPIAAAFEAHGYRLTLQGIGHIEMAVPRRRGPRVPAFISEMDVLATRTDAPHGAMP